MLLVRDPSEYRLMCEAARLEGKRVAIIPTMGALHEGHLSLVRFAKKRATFVTVSIFVNPTQFGPSEDLDRYPRDVAGDTAKLEAVGADLLFAPAAASMYPSGEETRVRVGRMAEPLCGQSRPGHFEGVATIVTKLFALAGPSIAVFGKKDYQQYRVIERVAHDLFLPVTVYGHPIVREADGLAMSSRNAYLRDGERERAKCLVKSLGVTARRFQSGERDAKKLRNLAKMVVAHEATTVEYVEIVDPTTLEPVPPIVPERALLAVAAMVGTTRLIDNIVLGEDPPPSHG